MKKESLAIFDLDGTLFDTTDVNYQAYAQALEQFGYSLDYRYFCESCNGRHYKDFLPTVSTSDPAVLNRIHQRKKELYAKYLDKAKPNDHLFRIMEGMTGYHKAIVTTASRVNCMQILEYFGKVNNFELILTQEDFAKTKPDPEGFLRAMEYFAMEPENTVIFDDSDVGVEAALRSGASVLAVKNI